MSTDFSLDALLNGSTSNTSVTSPPNNKHSPVSFVSPPFTATSTPGPAVLQICSVSLLTPPAEEEVPKKRNNKRKREEEDDSDKQSEEKKESVQSEPKKRKRVRTAYTRQQLQRLEYTFAQDPYPDMLMRQNIAEELGLPDQKIHVWFQNRRAKQRRIRGQPTAPSPAAVCAPLFQHPLTTLKAPTVPGTTTSSRGVYHYHQAQQKQHVQHQSVAVQTRPPPLSLPVQTHPPPLSLPTPSPSPSPVHFRMADRHSRSNTPSVSPPQSLSSISSNQLQVSPPLAPGSVVSTPVYPASYGFVFPSTRTSPHISSTFPYYHANRISSSGSQPPMYLTPPLSGNRVNSVIPAFPHFYHS